MNKWIRTIFLGLGIVVVMGLLIQVIPYGHDHTNPPVVNEPNWDSPQTREITKRACFDCHSNETVWPWYSNIAPVSWLVYRDVSDGREHLNFSEWDMHPSLPEGEGKEKHINMGRRLSGMFWNRARCHPFNSFFCTPKRA